MDSEPLRCPFCGKELPAPAIWEHIPVCPKRIGGKLVDGGDVRITRPKGCDTASHVDSPASMFGRTHQEKA